MRRWSRCGTWTRSRSRRAQPRPRPRRSACVAARTASAEMHPFRLAPLAMIPAMPSAMLTRAAAGGAAQLWFCGGRARGAPVPLCRRRA
eukprot:3917185-Rhodomonas_salina.3